MESGGCAQRMMLTRNFGLILLVLWFWPLQEPRRVRSVFIGIWNRMKGSHSFHCIIFKLKCVFPLLFSQRTCQTTYIPSRTMKTTSKMQSEHTQSLHHMNIRQFITCLNCILPIKFHFAILDFAPSHANFLWTTWISSRILTALSNTTGKSSHKIYATDNEFSTHSPAFWVFLRIKFAFIYLGISPIAC